MIDGAKAKDAVTLLACCAAFALVFAALVNPNPAHEVGAAAVLALSSIVAR